MFNHMGFLIHGFPIAFLRSGGTVKLDFSGPVELSKSGQNIANIWPMFGQNLVNIWSTSVQNLAKSAQNLHKICPKSGHADHVLKTEL